MTKTGPWSLLIVIVVIGLLAILAAALVAVVRRIRRRPAPFLTQRVRAVPHAGASDMATVEKVGRDVTVTVRIEPHPGEATTTVEKV